MCPQSRLPRKVKKGYRRKAVEAAMALALANQSRKEHATGSSSSRGSCSTASAATAIDEGRRRPAGATSSGRRRPGSRGVPANGAAGYTKMRTNPKVVRDMNYSINREDGRRTSRITRKITHYHTPSVYPRRISKLVFSTTGRVV